MGVYWFTQEKNGTYILDDVKKDKLVKKSIIYSNIILENDKLPKEIYNKIMKKL